VLIRKREIDMDKRAEAHVRDQALAATEPALEPVAIVQLIATVALALSTLIVATAVSIGLARAGVAGDVTSPDATSLAAGGLVALWLVGTGGLVAARIGARRR
jgi:hypothetical protein